MRLIFRFFQFRSILIKLTINQTISIELKLYRNRYKTSNKLCPSECSIQRNNKKYNRIIKFNSMWFSSLSIILWRVFVICRICVCRGRESVSRFHAFIVTSLSLSILSIFSIHLVCYSGGKTYFANHSTTQHTILDGHQWNSVGAGNYSAADIVCGQTETYTTAKAPATESFERQRESV